MARFITLAVGLCVLSGCTMFDSSPKTAALDVLPQFSPERTAAVPEGAKVEIERRYVSDQVRGTTTGVVLKASAEGLALANCTSDGTSIDGVPIANKLPYISRLFKNTGVGTERVPVLWLPASEISDVKVLEPAPTGFIAPPIEISSANTTPIGVDFDFNAADEGASDLAPVIAETGTTNYSAPTP